MTGFERFIAATAFQETDRPPHFEPMFELEREAFGMQFFDRQCWSTYTAPEKDRGIGLCMEIYSRIVERFKWDALCIYWPWGDPEGIVAARKTFGDDIAIGGMVGGALWSIDSVSDWMEFSADLMDNREKIHEIAERQCLGGIEEANRLIDAGADFLFLPHDVAFNGGPFVSPRDFSEIVTPYLARLIGHIRDQSRKAIFHSDGMLMPILDQIIDCHPHCLHSIDPMAGMDIAEVNKLTYGKMAASPRACSRSFVCRC